jgi:hypothetical protein
MKTYKLRPARLIRSGDLVKHPATGAEVRVEDVKRLDGEVVVWIPRDSLFLGPETLIWSKHS